MMRDLRGDQLPAWMERAPADDLPALHSLIIGLSRDIVVRSPLRAPAAPKTRTPVSAAVVEGHLVAVGVRERESAAERPVDGR